MIAWTRFTLLGIVTIIGAWTDCRTGKIYNWLTYPGMLIGLILAAWAGTMSEGVSGIQPEVGRAVISLLVGLVPFALLFLIGGIGGGDAKLVGVVGAMVADWETTVLAILYASAVGLLMAIFEMIRRGIVRRTLTTLMTAALSAAGKVKPSLPTDSPRLPYGVAVCIGGMVAGAEQFFGLRLLLGAD